MAKASELRDQRRARAVLPHAVAKQQDLNDSIDSDRVRVVRAESRDSLSTAGERGDPLAWEIDLAPAVVAAPARPVRAQRVAQRLKAAPLEATSREGTKSGRSLTKPPVPSARMRAVTSPAERRKPLIEPKRERPGSASQLKLKQRERLAPTSQVKPQVRTSRLPVAQSSAPARPARASPVSTAAVGGPAPIDKDPVTRQMIDRDTLRLENRAMFERAITYWRSHHAGEGENCRTSEHSRVHVYVRKRPLFEKEVQAREFDVVTVPSHQHSIVTHNCVFQADLKTPYLTHCSFSFTRCFDESTSNKDVFAHTSLRIVDHSKRGGIGTIFCFGQTGSGKTYTMTAIQHDMAERLMSEAPEATVQIIELCGKKVFDLLSVGSAGDKRIVKLRESANGGLVLDGASAVTVGSAAELVDVMSEAQARRNTESTGANDVSSRSHSVAIISLPTGGKLTLVDLAGSERRKDSMWHDKERQREGAEINSSLHALKECIRTSSGQRCVAFRLSTLTRVLAETFTNPKALLAVIATVSPCATDIEHTVSTLKTVQQLCGGSMEESKQTEMFPKPQVEAKIHPKRWTPDQVQVWLSAQGGCEGVSKSTTGAMLVRMPESRFIQACSGDEKSGIRLFRLLHDLIRSGPSSTS